MNSAQRRKLSRSKPKAFTKVKFRSRFYPHDEIMGEVHPIQYEPHRLRITYFDKNNNKVRDAICVGRILKVY
jgi:hypothetical protein